MQISKLNEIVVLHVSRGIDWRRRLGGFKQQHRSSVSVHAVGRWPVLFSSSLQRTVSTYRCVSEELGFKQTIAAFDVTLPIIPRSFSPPSHQQPDVTLESDEGIPNYYTTLELSNLNLQKGKTDEFMTPDSEKKARTNHRSTVNMNTAGKDAVCIAQKSYYNEMVAFWPLVCHLSLWLIAFVVLWRRSMRMQQNHPSEKNLRHGIRQYLANRTGRKRKAEAEKQQDL